MSFNFQHHKLLIITYHLKIINTQETASYYQNRAIEFEQNDNLNEIDNTEDNKIYDISPAINIISNESSQRFS